MRVDIFGSPTENINTLLAFMRGDSEGSTMPVWKRDLSIYLGGRFLTETATLMQSVAIGWRIYEISRSPMALGLVGLAQFVPMFGLTLPSGELCDRLDPRKILSLGLLIQALCSGALFALHRAALSALWPFYVVMILFGAARALTDSPGQAIL